MEHYRVVVAKYTYLQKHLDEWMEHYRVVVAKDTYWQKHLDEWMEHNRVVVAKDTVKEGQGVNLHVGCGVLVSETNMQ
ncbi:hypothetical protein DPMN_021266 [Dreissena polymorpha]|uniref:Uncharacterized protein n=1 Tax=Dreissena polymorpha TaxID=45954 RepID=A0A9D4NI92_DREPO|nr:hypothetical protein DPMN_021266 [Dreissena polymorpha]